VRIPKAMRVALSFGFKLSKISNQTHLGEGNMADRTVTVTDRSYRHSNRQYDREKSRFTDT